MNPNTKVEAEKLWISYKRKYPDGVLFAYHDGFLFCFGYDAVEVGEYGILTRLNSYHGTHIIFKEKRGYRVIKWLRRQGCKVCIAGVPGSISYIERLKEVREKHKRNKHQ